jgi:hypothetical protein
MPTTDQMISIKTLVGAATAFVVLLLSLGTIHSAFILPGVLTAAREQTIQMMDRQEGLFRADLARIERKLEGVATSQEVLARELEKRLASLEVRLTALEKH